MKSLPSLIATAAAAISLLLGLVLFVFGWKNQNLQSDLQKYQQEAQSQQAVVQVKQQQLQVQQDEINKAQQISQQVGPALLRDMAVASIKNDKMKKILTSHGYNVELKDEAKEGKKPEAAAPPAAPAPARPITPP